VEKGNICSSSCIEHYCLIYSPKYILLLLLLEHGFTDPMLTKGVRQNLLFKWLKFRDRWNHACRNSINRISPYFEKEFSKKMFFIYLAMVWSWLWKKKFLSLTESDKCVDRNALCPTFYAPKFCNHKSYGFIIKHMCPLSCRVCRPCSLPDIAPRSMCDQSELFVTETSSRSRYIAKLLITVCSFIYWIISRHAAWGFFSEK